MDLNFDLLSTSASRAAVVKMHRQYERRRNSLIPFAEAFANNGAGTLPVEGEPNFHERLEAWSVTWDRLFLTEMQRLSNALESSVD